MVSSSIIGHVHNLALIPVVLISIFAISFVSSYQFPVGGKIGWIKPTGNDTETYDKWATKHRFHVGDSLYFMYRRDSVLVVNSTDYENCIISNPISRYDDGNTTFRFDRHGFFYFISGQPGHCKAGQKLVVRVMVHPAGGDHEEAPNPAPSPEENGNKDSGKEEGDDWGGFSWGPPSVNSTIKASLASYFMTALVGMLVILYLLT
ncbi:hypothetical protein K2173_010566 [Erythroxylum novogranatense]|uniref:Phytocyanin domain-containing protein n=1 Tax=Erythroxylum novogranatense TaxID=1862640 RepID=A0AAV8TFR0_9ROSI|nr:hypothetical protein K2173_010566 [Erythroxylum novogranatense]